MDDSWSAAAASRSSEWLAEPPRCGLPHGFRLLCAGPQEPDWIALTLQLDAIGCHDPRFRWCSTASETLSILRNETFDCIVVVCGASAGAAHWDGQVLMQAIRTSGCDDPLIVLTAQSDDALTLEACRHHCDVLVTRSLLNSRVLVPFMQRSLRLVETARENHQHTVANHRRLVRERDEADHLLQQQRDIIQELEAITHGFSVADREQGISRPFDSAEPAPRPPAVPDQVRSYYQELLRTYVIMGSGSLGSEIAQLADILAEIGLGPADALSLHLERVEELVRGLGNRSTRHVMARADLLALEIVIRLGECYQRVAQDSRLA